MTQKLPRDEIGPLDRSRSWTAIVILLVAFTAALLPDSLQLVVIVAVTVGLSHRAIIRYRVLGKIADLLNGLN